MPYRLYTVKDGFIYIGEDAFPISLPNGDYSIRNLTPLECERLQTMPDYYTKYGRVNNEVVEISKGQRYKALGNGWTADVIAYIFSYIK